MTDNQQNGYKAALKQARASFNEAKTQREALDLQITMLDDHIAKLRRTITALAAMCSEDPQFDDLGITDAVMEFMEGQEREMSTNEVIEGLKNMGFDLSSQRNPAASVHAILSRISEQGKIVKVKKENRGVYWRGPKYDPDAIPI